MSLISYDEKLSLHPNGFINTGSSCYFNALLQSILSCTSFIKVIIAEKENIDPDNKVATLLINYILANKLDESSQSNTKSLALYSKLIYIEMTKQLCKRKKININKFMVGQQCVSEGFHYLLESLEKILPIQKLFLHRYKSLIYCFNCNKCVSDVECLYSLFEINPNLKSDQLKKFNDFNIKSKDMNSFISKQSSYVEDYKCNICLKSDDKFSINALVMVPEILVIMSKKYTVDKKLDIYTKFPEHMEFAGNEKNLCYTAVAQIEHSGGKNSGHYWSIVRRNGRWYNINDTIITPSEFKPTNDTYIVFYHLN
jgi:ubiquitin C-terminal hydrolase